MEELLNKKYFLEMEVLSPLHIGASQEKDWMKGADYVVDNNKLYKLNHKKLMQKISADDLANILIKKDDEALKRKIIGDISLVADDIFEAPVSSPNDIKSFIKNGLNNKPFVPGSSLKGALRSIIMNYLIGDSKPYRLNEKDIFGSANNGDEFMRFIKISDAQFDKTELVNTKIFNLYNEQNEFTGGWKHSGYKTDAKFSPNGFNTIYEILPNNQKSLLTISLSNKALENLLKDRSFRVTDKKKAIINNDISSTLFSIINTHTKKYIEKQIAFFNKYPNNETDAIIGFLEKLKEQIPNDNSSCVLQMAAGSGFHSITGDWQFDDFSIDEIGNLRGRSRGMLNHKESAKSRKIATDSNSFELMGFVKLTKITEEEANNRELVRLENLRKEHLERLEQSQKDEQERQLRIDEELRAKEEKARIEKEEQDKIEAVRQAKLEEERRVEAERIAKERLEQLKREHLIKQKEENEKKRQEVNKQKLEQGLSVLEQEDTYNSGKNLIEKYKKKNKSIEKSEFEYIKLFVKKYYSESDKEWNNFKRGKHWKEIKGWLGQETAQQWHNELNTKTL